MKATIYILRRLIGIMIYGYPFSELLSGFLFSEHPSKIITNSYVMIVSFMIVLYLVKSTVVIKKSLFYVIVIITSIIFLSMIGGSIDNYDIFYDVTLYIRSILFGFFLYLYLDSISYDRCKVFVNKFMSLWWILVTIFIFSSYYFNIGLYTYDQFQTGRKFYFIANNELTIFYSSLSIFMILSYTHIYRYIITVTSIFIFWVIAVKGFIVSIFIVLASKFFLQIYQDIKGYSIVMIIVLSVLFIGLVDVNTDELSNVVTNFFIEYGIGGDKFLHKISYLQNIDALLSERNSLIETSTRLIDEFNLFSWIFGFSYSGFGVMYGEKSGVAFTFVENDLVDVFFSYGIAGLLVYLYVFYYTIKSFFRYKNRLKFDDIYSIGVLNILLLGIAVGHGVFFSMPVLTFILFFVMVNKQKEGLSEK